VDLMLAIEFALLPKKIGRRHVVMPE